MTDTTAAVLAKAPTALHEAATELAARFGGATVTVAASWVDDAGHPHRLAYTVGDTDDEED